MAIALGNLGKLDQLAKRVEAMKSTRVRAIMAQRMSASAVKLVADCFKHESTPYGVPWAPLKQERSRPKDRRARARAVRKGQTKRDKILQRDGYLRGSVHATGHGTTVGVALSKEYASFHQDGAPGAHIPRRQILPDAAGGLPSKWRETFDRDAIKTLNELAGGAEIDWLAARVKRTGK